MSTIYMCTQVQKKSNELYMYMYIYVNDQTDVHLIVYVQLHTLKFWKEMGYVSSVKKRKQTKWQLKELGASGNYSCS